VRGVSKPTQVLALPEATAASQVVAAQEAAAVGGDVA
jgi:hypothetical protein